MLMYIPWPKFSKKKPAPVYRENGEPAYGIKVSGIIRAKMDILNARGEPLGYIKQVEDGYLLSDPMGQNQSRAARTVIERPLRENIFTGYYVQATGLRMVYGKPPALMEALHGNMAQTVDFQNREGHSFGGLMYQKQNREQTYTIHYDCPQNEYTALLAACVYLLSQGAGGDTSSVH